MLPQALFPLLTLPFFASAHFLLKYPPARGFDEDNQGTGPCGGQSLSDNRTSVSIASIPVLLQLGHDQTAIQILLGLGDDAENNFNITLRQTFGALGEGDFCLPSIAVPTDLGIQNGMNATLQVVTSGEGGGGLYNCADIIFTSATESTPSSCTNGTGITASAFPPAAATINANESLPTGGPQNGGSSSASGSATASGSNTEATGAAAMITTAWGVLGAAVVGAAALM